MPWLIVRRGKKYRVYRKGKNGRAAGKARGTHTTLKKARAQQNALYARVDEVMANAEIDLTPPQLVVDNAQSTTASASMDGMARGMRAISAALSEGKTLSAQQIASLYDWHRKQRHFGTKNATEEQAKAFLLMGGTAGRAWANRLYRKLHEAGDSIEESVTITDTHGTNVTEIKSISSYQWDAGATTEPAYTQAEANYTEQTDEPTRHCSICEHFLGNGTCELVENTPLAIDQDGVCDLFDAVSVEVDEMADKQKGYVSLTLNWVWEIERIQSALATLFGYDEAWRWLDPYTYHVTLAYSENVTDEQLLEAAKAVAGKTAPTLHMTKLGAFSNPDTGEKAVYLAVEKSEALAELQKAVYGALSLQDVPLSSFSAPDAWVPHMTLAYVSEATVVPEGTFDLMVVAGKVCLARADYESLAEIPLKYAVPDNRSEDGMGPVMEMAAWKVGVARDLPMMEGDPEWDGNAAAQSMFAACGFDGDAQSKIGTPDSAAVRKGFLIYNASAPKLRGSYKLPIAKMVDGKMMAVPSGLRAASSRLSQVKDVPQDVMDKAQKALDSYKKKAGIGEMDRTLIRMTYISEMRGGYPDIPLPDDIDRKALGESAFFVTLPIGQVGARSGNGRNYTETAVKELVQQINDLRPEGAWGHMTEEDMATRYDPPAIRWLAATLDKEGIAWGKGFPLNEPTREYYRLAKATNARVGTSLTAWAEMMQDDVEHIRLNTVDIADPVRVGVAVTAAKPMLTQEMGDVFVRGRAESPALPVREEAKPKEKDMLTEEQITEMQAQHAAQISELQKTLTAAQAHVTELETENSGLVKEVGVLLGEYIAKEVSEQVPLAYWRKRITKDVVREQPQSRDAVKEAVKRAIDDPDTQEAMKATVVEMMGTRQEDQPNGRITPSKYLVEVPEGE